MVERAKGIANIHTHTRHHRKVAKVIFQYPITPTGKPSDCSNCCCKLYTACITYIYVGLPGPVSVCSPRRANARERERETAFSADHIESVTARASLYVDGIGKSPARDPLRAHSHTRSKVQPLYIHLYSTRAIPLRPESICKSTLYYTPALSLSLSYSLLVQKCRGVCCARICVCE